jgi:hypothetical protein
MFSPCWGVKYKPYEDELINAILEAAAEPESEDDTDPEDDTDLEDDVDWIDLEDDEEQLPPAQLVTQKRYIYLERISVELLFTALKAGLLDRVFGVSLAPFACVASFVDLFRNAGSYYVSLEENEREFCRYLVQNYYTYSDRLKELFDFTKNGFSLQEAMEQYCACHPDPSAEASCFEAAQHLIEKNILVPANETDRYMIRF